MKKMYGNNILRRLSFFFVLLCVLCNNSCKKVPMPDYDQTMSVTQGKTLSGPWQYRWGDSPAVNGVFSWTINSFGDSAWETINLPASSPPGRTNEQNVWMRTRLPADLSNSSYLYVLAFDQAAEIFVDQKKIYGFGDIDNNGKGHFLGYGWHLIPLSPADAGKMLYFRVWSSHINIGIVGEVMIGDKASFLHQMLADSLQNSVIFVVFMLMGLASFVVFMSNRVRMEYLFFTIFTVAGVWLFTRTSVKFLILPHPRFWFTLEVVSMALCATGFVGFVCAIFDFSRLTLLRFLTWIGLALTLLTAVQALFSFESIMKFLLPTQMYVLVCAGTILAKIIGKWRQREIEAKFLGVGLALFLILVSIEMLVALGVIFPALMGKAAVMPWGLLIFACSMGLILVARLLKVYNRIARLKGQLENVLVGTREMAVSREKIEASKVALKHIIANLKMPKDLGVSLILRKIDNETASFSRATILAMGRIVEKSEAKAVSDYRCSLWEAALASGSFSRFENSYVLVPIIWGVQPVGLLEFGSQEHIEFDEEEKNFVSTLVQSLAISLANIDFVAEAREKVAMAADLQAAAAVQEALLPQSMSTFPGLRIASTYHSANQTGGDWTGYYYDSINHSLDFFVCDVTGHGFGASLLTGVVCGGVYCSENILSHLAKASGLVQTPAEKLQYMCNVINNVVLQTGRGKLMIGMALVSLDLKSGKCVLVNAGHKFPCMVDLLNKKVKPLVAAGNRIGFFETPTFGVKEFQLNPGDSVVLYTDGIVENTGPDHKTVYTERNLRKDLIVSDNILEARDKVIEHAKAVWQGHPPDDDITFLGVQWIGPIERTVDLSGVNIPGVQISAPDAAGLIIRSEK